MKTVPGLAYLCKELWYLFPMERYQYSVNEKRTHSIEIGSMNNYKRKIVTNRRPANTSNNHDFVDMMNYNDVTKLPEINDHDYDDQMEDDLFT